MEMTEKKFAMPYTLQFFAEDDDSNGGENEGEGKTEPTIEELQAEIANQKNLYENSEKLRQKEKAALDKALKEVARLTKESRANKTEAEIEAENKRVEFENLQEENKELRAYKQLNEAKDRYLLQGMSSENALKAAEAEVAGDMDALAEIQKKHTEALIKTKEAEWKKTRPDANVGTGNSWQSLTKEEILAIEDDQERYQAIAANREKFNF